MFRRTVLVAAAAIAVVFVPTAALAYPAPMYQMTVSDPSPEVGQSFGVTVSGGSMNTAVTLTLACPSASDGAIEIAGTKSSTKNFDADGRASFVTTVSAASNCMVQAFVGGDLVQQQFIGIHPEGSADYVMTISDSPPTATIPFTVTVSGGVSNEQVTLVVTCSELGDDAITIAGQKEMTKPMTGGVVSFTTTVASAVDNCAVGAFVDNVLRDFKTVSVQALAPDAAVQPKDPGPNGMGLAAGAGLPLLAGLGALVLVRRRKLSQDLA